MKLWNVTRGKGRNAIYRIFGWPIYLVRQKSQNLRVRLFCKGLVSSHAIQNNSTGTRLKDFLICGHRVSRYGIDEYVYQWIIFGIKVIYKKDTAAFYKRYHADIPSNTDYIFFLSVHIGEFSYFLTYFFSELLKRKHIRHPLFVTTFEYHKKILHMFFPDIPILICSESKVLLPREGEFNVEQIPSSYLFSDEYFINIEKNIRLKRVHFLSGMSKYLNMERSSSIAPICIDEHLHKVVLNKLKQLSLDRKPFVYVVPHASSCQLLPSSFWNELFLRIHQKGLDIFLNPHNLASYPDWCHTIDLSLEEVFIVAQHAKAIIGLRSGLLDLLIRTKTPIHAIYTDFRPRVKFKQLSADLVLSGFSLHYCSQPGKTSEIFEYLVHQTNLQEQIITNL